MIDDIRAKVGESLGITPKGLVGMLPNLCIDCLRPRCFIACLVDLIRPGIIFPKENEGMLAKTEPKMF